MLDQLAALEAKLTLLLERHQALREENTKLRQQAVALENTNRQLADRLNEARGRLEALYDKIPD
jgi:FtsZ-binding cell division protein ZapB